MIDVYSSNCKSSVRQRCGARALQSGTALVMSAMLHPPVLCYHRMSCGIFKQALLSATLKGDMRGPRPCCTQRRPVNTSHTIPINSAQQLLTYTIGLLILIATLAIPVPWALCRGFTKHSKEHAFRWRQV